jgi:hypothetical protein
MIMSCEPSVVSRPYDEMDWIAGAGWSHLGDQFDGPSQYSRDVWSACFH